MTIENETELRNHERKLAISQPVVHAASTKYDRDLLTLESSLPPTRATKKASARQIVAARIANDVTWALSVAGAIWRYRRREQSQHRTARQNDARRRESARTERHTRRADERRFCASNAS